jgi:TonB family protein
MKIVCDACSAKYSISDDKVQGKVFKIRCKKCQNIIVVRGGVQASEPEPKPLEKETRVYDYGDGTGAADGGSDDQVWYIVVDQEQVGPLSVAEVQERFLSGQIDAESYVWRDTFADWLPLAQVDEFASLAAGGAASGGGAAAVASMFGSTQMHEDNSRRDKADVFMSGPSRAVEEDDNDLFGKRSNPGIQVHAAQAAAEADSKLRGQRNENSVLFSLNNLAQLASDSPKSASVSAQSGGVLSAPASSGGEGSGLIDIRSMASAYMGDRGAPSGAKKPASMGVGSMDDLPVFSTSGFSEPAVLMPLSNRSSANSNKLIYGLIGAVALLGVIVLFLVLRKDSSSAPAEVAVTETDKPGDKTLDKPNVASAAMPNKPSGEEQKAADPTPPNEGAGTTVPPPDKPADVAAKVVDKTLDKRGKAEKPKAAAIDKVADKKPPKEAGTASPPTGGCDEISCVMDNYAGACCAKFKRGGKTAPVDPPKTGGGNLPESLDKDMMTAGVSKVQGKAQSCGGQSSAKGVVKVSIKVGADGRVTGVTVKQTPDPALGSCVAAAVQRATFAKTQNGGSFTYPVSF